MTIRSLLAVIVVLSFAMAACVTVADFGHAKDRSSDESDDYSFEDFLDEIEKDKEDQKRCRGNDDASPSEQQEACTRLIEGAPVENDLVGEYYIDRAMTGEDATQRCQDVRKGISIIERSKSNIYGKPFLDAARRLEEAVCQ